MLTSPAIKYCRASFSCSLTAVLLSLWSLLMVINFVFLGKRRRRKLLCWSPVVSWGAQLWGRFLWVTPVLVENQPLQQRRRFFHNICGDLSHSFFVFLGRGFWPMVNDRGDTLITRLGTRDLEMTLLPYFYHSFSLPSLSVPLRNVCGYVLFYMRHC